MIRYIIIKKEEIDNESCWASGIWYYVVPKSLLIRLFIGYHLFRNLEKAKECKKLLEEKKWKYTKKREILK